MRFSSLCLGSLAALIVGTAGAVWAEESAKAPWEVNRPIVEVQKERYRTHRRPRESALAAVSSVGPKLELCEVQSYQTLSDVGEEIRARWSTDNGRTWSEFVPLQASNLISYENVPVWEGGAMAVHDPGTGRLVQLWLREIHHADLFHTFTYCRISSDLGRTWSTPKPLVYEPTVDFDPKTPLNPAYLNHNEGYPGNNILVRRDGTLVTCLAHTNAPGDPKNDQRPWRMGSVLMLGRWNAQRQEYDWQPGARVEISPEDSARGLMEPGVVELKDGRLLIVWRGSTEGYDNTVSKLPGYKFYSLSSDGGRTLTPPGPLDLQRRHELLLGLVDSSPGSSQRQRQALLDRQHQPDGAEGQFAPFSPGHCRGRRDESRADPQQRNPDRRP